MIAIAFAHQLKRVRTTEDLHRLIDAELNHLAALELQGNDLKKIRQSKRRIAELIRELDNILTPTFL